MHSIMILASLAAGRAWVVSSQVPPTWSDEISCIEQAAEKFALGYGVYCEDHLIFVSCADKANFSARQKEQLAGCVQDFVYRAGNASINCLAEHGASAQHDDKCFTFWDTANPEGLDVNMTQVDDDSIMRNSSHPTQVRFMLCVYRNYNDLVNGVRACESLCKPASSQDKAAILACLADSKAKKELDGISEVHRECVDGILEQVDKHK